MVGRLSLALCKLPQQPLPGMHAARLSIGCLSGAARREAWAFAQQAATHPHSMLQPLVSHHVHLSNAGGTEYLGLAWCTSACKISNL